MDAVGGFSILNDTYYRDLLCEVGGMFSIANMVDNIHKRPWIGFQSWRAASWKVFLILIFDMCVQYLNIRWSFMNQLLVFQISKCFMIEGRGCLTGYSERE